MKKKKHPKQAIKPVKNKDKEIIYQINHTEDRVIINNVIRECYGLRRV